MAKYVERSYRYIGRNLKDHAEIIAEQMKIPAVTTALFDCLFLGPELGKCLGEIMSGNTNNVKKLVLSNNNIQLEGLIDLVEGLSTNTTLTWLDLSSNDLGQNFGNVLARLLFTNKSLRTLDLRLIFNQPWTKSFVEAVASSSTLRSLRTSTPHVHCANEHLSQILSRNTSLRSLDLRISAREIQKFTYGLSLNQTLTKLKLRNSGLLEPEVSQIAQVLRTNTSLLVLNLDDNPFIGDGIVSLCQMLEVNTTLTCLSLAHVSFLQASADALMKVLQINTSLRELNVSGAGLNWIQSQKILGFATQVYSLDISSNSMGEFPIHLQNLTTLNISSSSWSGELTPWPNLRNLYLSGSNLRGKIGPLCDQLAHNCELRKLKISNCKLDRNDFDRLSEALKTNSKLRSLDPSYNDFETVEYLRLFSCLTFNKGLKSLTLEPGVPQIGLFLALQINHRLTKVKGVDLTDTEIATLLDLNEENRFMKKTTLFNLMLLHVR